MEIKIALAGNPNCGKTTLFNVLTGSNQYVGNWPGVTVEKKEGKLKNREGVIVTDLPGIYSLSPYTLEEVVARNYLINECPDAILNIVDGTNLERNLYLTTQLIEIGIPVVVAINMMDIVRKNGDKINIEELSCELGCKVIEISALKSDGITEAIEAAIEAAQGREPIPVITFSGVVEHAIAHIEEAAVHSMSEEKQRWYAVKIFERDEKVIEQLGLDENKIAHIENDIVRVEKKFDDDAEAIIINERYSYIDQIIKKCYKKKNKGKLTISDKIDRIATNRILALPIFAVVMWLVYYLSIGSVGAWSVDFMNNGLFGSFAETYGENSLLGRLMSIPELLDLVLLDAAGEPVIWGWLYSLIQDGIIPGVGAVLGFVPQMLVLFMLLSILEDCGYMSRVAFIMDRIFRKFGLSGKSFIPMLVATGCGVPGIMASRTIESERDRRMTVMTTGFMVCGAKTPIVGLIAGTFFEGTAAAWVSTGAYFIGIAAIALSGIILKKFKAFAGEAAPFVMELPSYHAPVASNIFRTTWERGWSFIKRAGSVIFIASVLIWCLQSLTFDGGIRYIGEDGGRSVLQTIGSALDFIFAPVGFGNWQAVVATILGLVAKEEVVAVLEELSAMLGSSDVAQIFGNSTLAAFSFMVFNLLCAPCFAAMGAIKREMNSAKWTFACLGYMTAFAYAVSLIVYNFGMLFAGVFTVWTALSFVVFAVMLYLLFRKNKYAYNS